MDRGAARASGAGERTPTLLPDHARRARGPHRRSRTTRTACAPGEGPRAHRRRAMSRSYRALMRLAPRDLRERHGAAMEEMFAERLAAARARGRIAASAVWMHAVVDLLEARVKGWQRTTAPLTVHIEERT